MSSTARLACSRYLQTKSAHLSPAVAFGAGALGGPVAAGLHGHSAGNGSNEAGRALLMSKLLSGAGLVGGAALGHGIGVAGTRKYLQEVTPAIGRLTLNDGHPEARQAIAALLKGGLAIGGGLLGTIGGSTLGAGIGAMQSARSHNQQQSQDLLHRLRAVFSR